MVTLVGVILLLLFFILMCNKKIAYLFLRISSIIIVLFLINSIVNYMGIAIPINLFTLIVIGLLRVPGILCIGGLTFLKLFL